MHLDMLTMSIASIAVTAALGLVLVFTWVRERQCALVGWWGLALMVTSIAIVAGVASSAQNATTLLSLANALLLLGKPSNGAPPGHSPTALSLSPGFWLARSASCLGFTPAISRRSADV
jgi:hypothetical protein